MVSGAGFLHGPCTTPGRVHGRAVVVKGDLRPQDSTGPAGCAIIRDQWSLPMTTMIAELYDALVSAGAPEDKARKAAETVAAYENRFASIDVKLTKIDGDINLLKWMLGLLLAGVASLVIKAFVA